MAYELGTASGYTDLLERLKDFLSDPLRTIGDHPNMDELVAIDDDISTGEASHAWTIDRWTDDRNTAGVGEIEMIAHGPGSAGADEIYVGIDTYSSGGDDYYNWRLMGMTGFSSGATLANQPGRTQGRLPRMLLHTNPLKYWFVANGRRFIVVAKISSVYECCYMGYWLPYGLPTQFPYPLAIGGSACPGATASHHRYSSEETNHRGFPNPYGNADGVCTASDFDDTADYSTLKFLQGVSWIKMESKSGSTSFTLYRNNHCWPYVQAPSVTPSPAEMWSQTASPSLHGMIRENIDGSYPIFPIIPMIDNPNNHILGELQGCYAVPGFGGIAAEDTFTVDGITYVAFPIISNADRTDWWALKKE